MSSLCEVEGTVLCIQCCRHMERDRKDNPVFTGEQVRQGRIILRKPWQRWLFGIGLFGGIVLTILLTVFASYATTSVGENASLLTPYAER